MSRDANNYFISEENSSGEAIAMSIYGTWQQQMVGCWWCQYGTTKNLNWKGRTMEWSREISSCRVFVIIYR